MTLDDYKEIPLYIIQGYSTLVTEIWQQMLSDCRVADETGQEKNNDVRPDELTHVFLQVGAGLFAGGMTNAIIAKAKAAAKAADKEGVGSVASAFMPKIVAVEASGAHCFYNSIKADDGQLHSMEGELVTAMAGLHCGPPSDYGWKALKDNASAFLSCQDSVAFTGMRTYFNPHGTDDRIISGESGAVTLGALVEIFQKMEEVKKALDLNEASRVLIISTEGDTDP